MSDMLQLVVRIENSSDVTNNIGFAFNVIGPVRFGLAARCAALAVPAESSWISLGLCPWS